MPKVDWTPEDNSTAKPGIYTFEVEHAETDPACRSDAAVGGVDVPSCRFAGHAERCHPHPHFQRGAVALKAHEILRRAGHGGGGGRDDCRHRDDPLG